METLGNAFPAFPAFKYYCNCCDYGTSKKNRYSEHLNTAKHKKHAFGNNLETFGNAFPAFPACNNCFKEFKHRSGLWKHSKVCKVELENNNHFEITNEVIMNILKQNSEFQQLLLEQNKTIIELSKNNQITNNTTNNNNSHNKSFNLQFFLNETCKNAMNMTAFIDSLQLQLSDLEKVGELGYVEGISNIILKNLNALDITLRPIHCTDKKRETMYIKDEDKWEKEDEKKVKLHKMVRKVANKNIDLISDFKELYPDWKKSTSRVSDQFNKIVIESMGGPGDNEYENEEKVIKKVAKEVFIDKGL